MKNNFYLAWLCMFADYNFLVNGTDDQGIAQQLLAEYVGLV